MENIEVHRARNDDQNKQECFRWKALAPFLQPMMSFGDGSPDLVVMGRDSPHILKVMASNSCTIYWMDIFYI